MWQMDEWTEGWRPIYSCPFSISLLWGDDKMTDQNVICNLGMNNCKRATITFDITNLITKQIILQKAKEKLLIKSTWKMFKIKLVKNRLQMSPLRPVQSCWLNTIWWFRIFMTKKWVNLPGHFEWKCRLIKNSWKNVLRTVKRKKEKENIRLLWLCHIVFTFSEPSLNPHVNWQGNLPVIRHNTDKQIMTFHRACPPHFQCYTLLAALRLVIELPKQRETRPLQRHSTQ